MGIDGKETVLVSILIKCYDVETLSCDGRRQEKDLELNLVDETI